MKRNKSSNYLDAVFQEGEESINHVRQLITRQTFELNVHRRKPVNLDYEGVNAKVNMLVLQPVWPKQRLLFVTHSLAHTHSI